MLLYKENHYFERSISLSSWLQYWSFESNWTFDPNYVVNIYIGCGCWKPFVIFFGSLTIEISNRESSKSHNTLLINQWALDDADYIQLMNKVGIELDLVRAVSLYVDGEEEARWVLFVSSGPIRASRRRLLHVTSFRHHHGFPQRVLRSPTPPGDHSISSNLHQSNRNWPT